MTSTHYQARYKARMREKGFVKTEVWVPEPMRSNIQEYAKSLREIWEGPFSGEETMWDISSLKQAIESDDRVTSGEWSVEEVQGADDCLVVTSAEHGDAQAFVSIGDDQMLVSSLLFPVSSIADPNEFNHRLLATHKLMPLTTLAITAGPDGHEWYECFGALSTRSSVANVLLEIDTLLDNVIDCAEAFSADMKDAAAA